jgi:hypothetical protein
VAAGVAFAFGLVPGLALGLGVAEGVEFELKLELVELELELVGLELGLAGAWAMRIQPRERRATEKMAR